MDSCYNHHENSKLLIEQLNAKSNNRPMHGLVRLHSKYLSSQTIIVSLHELGIDPLP